MHLTSLLYVINKDKVIVEKEDDQLYLMCLMSQEKSFNFFQFQLWFLYADVICLLIYTL